MSGVRKRLVKTKTRYGSVCGHIDEEEYDTISIPESLPAEQDHPISQTWRKDKVGEAIISVLEVNKILFDAVDFLRRPRLMSYFNILSDGKFCKNDDSHTIVITVTEFRAFDPKFNKIMDVIHDKLTDQTTVEVRMGNVKFFSSRPYAGSSLGLSDDSSSHGTLGGFVNLVDKKWERTVECALTCEHIVRPHVHTDESKALRPKTKCTESYICKTKKDRKQSIFCSCPSIPAYMKDVCRRKKDLTRLAGTILAYKHNDNKEIFPPDELKALKRERNTIRREMKNAHLSDDLLGAIYASSGHNFSRHGHRLDWALIQVSPGLLPNAWRNHVSDGYGRSTPRQILQASKPQKNAAVYKHGSVTGMTVGIVNPIRSYVVIHDANGKRSVTKEWCVVPDGDSEYFAKEGDSGALVLDRETADVMGMIFAGHSFKGGPVYFTSITAIATDIEKVTGLRVQLPGGGIIG